MMRRTKDTACSRLRRSSDNYNDYCDCLYFEHKLYVQFRRSIRKNVRQIYIYNGNCRDAAGN